MLLVGSLRSVNTMIEYWHYTENDSYNDIVKEAMFFSIGQGKKLNMTTKGNDDYGAWGVAATCAVEMKVGNLNSKQSGRLYFSQAVVNSITAHRMHKTVEVVSDSRFIL